MRRTPAPVPDREIPPPLLAGRWRLVRTLETSGSGAVFLAWDDAQRLWCAVEIAREEGGIRRLARERSVLGELDHPHVDAVAVVEVEGPVVYAARRYLREHAGRFAPAAPGHAVRLALAATEALVHAHGRGRIHGTLGEEQLRFDAEGRVVVTGWADRPEALPPDARLARLAPEVRAGAQPDPRSDVFAIGGLLYALVTGRPRADLHLGPTAAGAFDGMSPGLRQVVTTCCAHDPAVRPKTAAELHQWLARRVDAEEAPPRTPWAPKRMPPGPPPVVTPDAPLAGLARLRSHRTAGVVRRPLRAPSGDSASGTLEPEPRTLPSDRSFSSTRGSLRTRTTDATERTVPSAVARPPRPRRSRGLVALLLAGLAGLATTTLGALPVAAWWVAPPKVDDTAGRELVDAVLRERTSIGPISAEALDPEPIERAWFLFDDRRTPEAAAEVVRQLGAADRESLDPELRRVIARLKAAEDAFRSVR